MSYLQYEVGGDPAGGAVSASRGSSARSGGAGRINHIANALTSRAGGAATQLAPKRLETARRMPAE